MHACTMMPTSHSRLHAVCEALLCVSDNQTCLACVGRPCMSRMSIKRVQSQAHSIPRVHALMRVHKTSCEDHNNISRDCDVDSRHNQQQRLTKKNELKVRVVSSLCTPSGHDLRAESAEPTSTASKLTRKRKMPILAQNTTRSTTNATAHNSIQHTRGSAAATGRCGRSLTIQSHPAPAATVNHPPQVSWHARCC